ncbi:site-2 protease family protein [bacterium]|nr:site-2 protease family protein [bacterium]
MEFFFNALAVVAVFGLIVFIHEWGHMMAAKRAGVAVPTFAIGMGPSLFRFTLGETEYHLCLFPLGGFVKIEGMVDDGHMPAADPQPIRAIGEEDKPLDPETISEMEKKRRKYWKHWQDINGWEKASILIAGPVMNILAALLTIFVMGQIGFQVNEVMINGVEEGMPAQESGMQAGDIIRSINGTVVEDSQQFIHAVQASGGEQLSIGVVRQGQEIEIAAMPRTRDNFNEGKLSLGVVLTEVMKSSNVVALVPARSSGYSAGLRVGDRVVELNGEPVTNGLDVLLAMAPFNEANYEAQDYYGHPLDEEGYPLNEQGERFRISAEGLLLGTDGQPLKSEITGEPMEADIFGPLNLKVEREGEIKAVTLPAATTMVSGGLNFRPDLVRLPFGRAVSRSLDEAKYSMLGILDGMRAIFTKEGSKSVGGPIMIFNLIGQSASSDIYTFLMMFMVININLGILNLMPFPLLDGGRLVFVALKGIGLNISEHSEATVHFVGSLILIGFILYVSFFDVLALIPRSGGG